MALDKRLEFCGLLSEFTENRQNRSSVHQSSLRGALIRENMVTTINLKKKKKVVLIQI